MSNEIKQQWLLVSIERGGNVVHDDAYYRDFSTRSGLSRKSLECLKDALIAELETALVRAREDKKTNLEIKLIY